MAFYYSKRKLKPREEEHAGELNIVPYLDILMNLIIFMLLSMTGLAAFGILNVNAPNYGQAGPTQGGENQDQKLLLTVAVSHKGFFVAGAGAVLGQQAPSAPGAVSTEGQPTLPKNPDGSYDYVGLAALMRKIKQDPSAATERKVIIAAEADTAYETVVQTMDTVRGEENPKDPQCHYPCLFPEVTLAAM
jgi:biopolymer transport protein TolR